MSDEEVRDFRKENNNIEVKNFLEDDDTPLLKPVSLFEHAFHNYPDIMSTIIKQGFNKPSPIQCQAWPYHYTPCSLLYRLHRTYTPSGGMTLKQGRQDRRDSLRRDEFDKFPPLSSSLQSLQPSWQFSTESNSSLRRESLLSCLPCFKVIPPEGV